MTCYRLAGLVMAAVLSACASAQPVVEARPLNGTAWVLDSLEGQPPLPGHAATLRFEGSRAAGSDGCNRYMAEWQATESKLAFLPGPATTMMACEPAVMARAEAYRAALAAADAYRREADRLVLLADDGRVLATFVSQPSGLAGTAWRVTGYNNGKQAVVSILADTAMTIAFDAEGRATGSAGCNRYTAAYSQDGEKVTVGPAAATRRMCARPDGVMEQEALFLKALETVAAARIEGDALELRTATGALAVRAARSAE
jgi:heat shock protein HslJ